MSTRMLTKLQHQKGAHQYGYLSGLHSSHHGGVAVISVTSETCKVEKVHKRNIIGSSNQIKMFEHSLLRQFKIPTYLGKVSRKK